MRQIKTLRQRVTRAIAPHYRPTGDQPSPSGLMDIELSLYLLETVAKGQSASGVPALLDGYRTLWHISDRVVADARVRMANARQLLWRTQSPYRWDSVLDTYKSVPEEVRGYNFDALGRPERRPCRVAADRWAAYEEILTLPMPFETVTARIAEPGRYRMTSTSRGIGITLPEGMPTFATARAHNFTARPRSPIYVTWEDLLATARQMDATDAALGRTNAWEKRLSDVTLQVRGADHTFNDAQALTIDAMLHMVGMVSAGKSTLVMVLSVWAAGNGRTVTIVVGDNSAALRVTHDLSAYDAVRVAPVMGLNRSRHTERLHRLQPPALGRLLPLDEFGFDLVSTACGISALREAATPLAVREAPCQALVSHDDNDAVDGWRDKPKFTCPQWHDCQRHEASRRLVDANIWIATPWSLVHTAVPTPLGGTQIRYLEAAWLRSDLVVVDEADQVQANLDEMFANAQVLLGSSEEAWIDEIGTRVADKLRRGDRAQTSSKQVRRFTSAVNHARTAADLIYQLLQRDRSRAGKPVLNWIDQDYFTAWALFQQLAQDWAGYTTGPGRKPADGWEDDPLYQTLSASFNAFIDDPTASSGDPLAAELSRLAVAQLSDIEEDSRETLVRDWLEELSEQELAPDRKITPTDMDRNIWRLEVALAVAVMAHRLNLMLTMWPQVAGELDMYDVITAELRKPPADLTAVVPESPMGNVLGFQYVEDDNSSHEGQMGEFRFFRYSGVGRMLLVNLSDLFPAEGPGPNVLLLSGTSWAGTSPRFHIDVPVGAILRPSLKDLAEIAKTTFALDIQHTGERRTPIWVSGRYGPQRHAALQQMVKELTKPGPGPGSLNRLERERATLPANRQKIMLLVGSYAEARHVTDALLKAKSSWKGHVRCLIGDDELESGWDDPHHLRRTDVADFGGDEAWLLVTPILAIERGHNILNEDGVAAIGAAFFLVRPHPRPKDLSYVTQRINQYATAQMHRGFDGASEPHLLLDTAGKARRRAAQRQWRRLLHTLVAYSQLGDDERARVAWTQLVTIWQVVGRLVRGGQAAKVYFCDAAFAPKTAQRSDNTLDDASTSLLYGIRDVLEPYFAGDGVHADRHLVQALYHPLYRALTDMGDH
jgi:hypothetical protein